MPAARNPKNRINTIGFDGESSFGFSAANAWSGACSVAAMSVMEASGVTVMGKESRPVGQACDASRLDAMSTSSPQQRAADQTPAPNLHRRKGPIITGLRAGDIHSTGWRAPCSARLLVVLGVVFRGL